MSGMDTHLFYELLKIDKNFLCMIRLMFCVFRTVIAFVRAMALLKHVSFFFVCNIMSLNISSFYIKIVLYKDVSIITYICIRIFKPLDARSITDRVKPLRKLFFWKWLFCPKRRYSEPKSIDADNRLHGYGFFIVACADIVCTRTGNM